MLFDPHCACVVVVVSWLTAWVCLAASTEVSNGAIAGVVYRKFKRRSYVSFKVAVTLRMIDTCPFYSSRWRDNKSPTK